MMIAFEKVSLRQYCADCKEKNITDVSNPVEIYNNIELPHRSTIGSAGYDFIAPYDFILKPGESIAILTGIRAIMPNGIVLLIAPRSGQGIKYKLQLMNTIGVIDADYQYANNEGHIMIAIFNDNRKDAVLTVKQGTAFAQGLFLPYYVTDDDNVTTQRQGGFGSTDKKTLDNEA